MSNASAPLGMLGKRPPRLDPRSLRFARYVLPSALPPLPQWVRWSMNARSPWGMLLNDRIGSCTCASAGHAIHTWTANHGAEVMVSDAAILAAYRAVSGYDPVTGAGDNGAVVIDLLNYWRNTGVEGHRIGAYVTLAPQDAREVKEAIYLFGGVYVGLSLPAAVQGQGIWYAPRFRFDFAHPAWRPGSWGGHAVYCVDYDARYVTCVTWGQLLKMEWGFFTTYCEEAYGIISPQWVNDTNKAPNGFDIHSLVEDLARLGAP